MYDFETIPDTAFDAAAFEAGWAPDAGVTRSSRRREAPRMAQGLEAQGPEAHGVEGTQAAPIAGGTYREAMARLASAVHVVTTDGPGGRAGFTASAVCSVSDAPPTLLVCLNRGFSAYPAFTRNGTLCVNTLTAEQQGIADAFGGKRPMDARFASGVWTRLATGAPVLAGSLLAFDCRIVERSAVATHDVLFCEVLALAAPAEAASLLYAGRRYHTLPHPAGDVPALQRA